MPDIPRCISVEECPGRVATLTQSKGKLQMNFACGAFESINGYIIRDCDGVEIF